MDEMTNPERLRELRLTGLLHDLVEEHGRGKAAEELGVDRKTLWRCMNSGKLTPTLAEALERRMLAGQRSDLRRQRAHLDTLEERVEALAGALSAGLDAVRSEVEAVAGVQAEALGQWQRRLAEVEARGAGRDGTQATVPPAVKGAPQPVIGKPAVSKPWRPYPQLVTLEPEAGEELIYGAATPLIVEWRQASVEHIDRGRRRLDRATAWVRMRELEIVLIGEHELTLAPAVYPWNGMERGREVWRREQSLADARAERRGAQFWRWVRRVVTLGLWWK